MSKYEDPMIFWYWDRVGGTLCKEFPAVRKGEDCERRSLDAIILPKKPKGTQYEPVLRDQHVIVVQAKANRLGMPLMGQTLFSGMLVKQNFNPDSLISVALCKEKNLELHRLLKRVAKKIGIDDIRVEVVPESFQERKWQEQYETPMIDWYWKNKLDRKGRLFNNFQVPDKTDAKKPLVNCALILPKSKSEWINWSDKSDPYHKSIYKSLNNREVTIIHTEKKLKRIGMSVMGKALFSAILVKQKFSTGRIRSVVLCKNNDSALCPLLKEVEEKVGIDMEVVPVPEVVSR